MHFQCTLNFRKLIACQDWICPRLLLWRNYHELQRTSILDCCTQHCIALHCSALCCNIDIIVRRSREAMGRSQVQTEYNSALQCIVTAEGCKIRGHWRHKILYLNCEFMSNLVRSPNVMVIWQLWRKASPCKTIYCKYFLPYNF